MPQHDRLDDVTRVDDMFRRAGLPDAPLRPTVDPEARRRRRLRAGIATVLSLLVIAALIGAYCYATLTAPLPVPTGAVSRPQASPGPAAALVLPSTGEFAVSVAGADEYLGPQASTSFATSGGDGALPMASISKLVTALVVLDRKPLGASGTGPTITFTKADHDLYDAYYVRGATIAEMPATMTEHDAIETMLVASASNYAEAVSTWAFGSQASFLAATRTWLGAKGLTHTRMVDPTGLDPRNVSTPSDLIALGKLALADPAIAAIVAQKTLDVPGVPNYAATNTLLGADGVDGIKTGTLPGVANLLFSAKVSIRGLEQPVRLVGVDLGSPSHENTEADVDSFVQSLGDGFHDVKVATAGRVVGTYTTPWGSRARMVLRDGASLFTWSDTAVSSRMTPVVLGTGRKGARVGSVTWTAGSRTVTVPVVLEKGIRPPSSWWRLTHPHELLGWG